MGLGLFVLGSFRLEWRFSVCRSWVVLGSFALSFLVIGLWDFGFGASRLFVVGFLVFAFLGFRSFVLHLCVLVFGFRSWRLGL